MKASLDASFRVGHQEQALFSETKPPEEAFYLRGYSYFWFHQFILLLWKWIWNIPSPEESTELLQFIHISLIKIWMQLVIWTQPSGPLCLWQCFLFVPRPLSFTEPFNLRIIGEPAFPRSLQSVYINYTYRTNHGLVVWSILRQNSFNFLLLDCGIDCYLILKRTHLGYSWACLLKYL